MFACRLLLCLKHRFCIPNVWDSASSWKKFKQRQLVTQCSGGSDLAVRRCVGVIAAAINISETREELGAGAGGAGRSHLLLNLSELGWAGGMWSVLLPGTALQLEAPFGAHPSFPTGRASGGLPLQCSFGNGQSPGRVLISLHVSTCISTLVQWQWKQSGLLFPKLKE